MRKEMTLEQFFSLVGPYYISLIDLIVSDVGESQQVNILSFWSCYILKICHFTTFSFIRSYESEIDHVYILQ